MLLIVRSPWRNLLPALAFLSLAMVLGGMVFRRRVDDELHAILALENLRVARLAALALSRPGVALQEEVVRLAVEADARVTVIDPEGRVLADSSADAESMESHARRPEVIGALERGVGESTRRSATVGRTMIYTAVSIRAPAPDLEPGPAPGLTEGATPDPGVDAAESVSVVRVARTLASVDDLLASVDRAIWGATAVAILVSLLGCYLLIEVRISREERIQRGPGPRPG